jgi:mono/diheme cytochrome c family protein
MPVHSLLLSASFILAGVELALGQQLGDPVSGRRLAEATCFHCHGVANNPAPAFSAIAAMPSTTARSLSVFLRSSHPTMPNLMLSDAERDDLIAYILSLR